VGQARALVVEAAGVRAVVHRRRLLVQAG
jgi:hypothetical protein